MPVTSLKLPAELKQRIHSLVEGTGRSAHAFMVEAIEGAVSREELRRRFGAEAPLACTSWQVQQRILPSLVSAMETGNPAWMSGGTVASRCPSRPACTVPSWQPTQDAAGSMRRFDASGDTPVFGAAVWQAAQLVSSLLRGVSGWCGLLRVYSVRSWHW